MCNILRLIGSDVDLCGYDIMLQAISWSCCVLFYMTSLCLKVLTDSTKHLASRYATVNYGLEV